jgi:hypothetical protein
LVGISKSATREVQIRRRRTIKGVSGRRDCRAAVVRSVLLFLLRHPDMPLKPCHSDMLLVGISKSATREVQIRRRRTIKGVSGRRDCRAAGRDLSCPAGVIPAPSCDGMTSEAYCHSGRAKRDPARLGWAGIQSRATMWIPSLRRGVLTIRRIGGTGWWDETD